MTRAVTSVNRAQFAVRFTALARIDAFEEHILAAVASSDAEVGFQPNISLFLSIFPVVCLGGTTIVLLSVKNRANRSRCPGKGQSGRKRGKNTEKKKNGGRERGRRRKEAVCRCKPNEA